MPNDLERAEERALARKAIDTLTERDREALLMREEGFKYEEIARAVADVLRLPGGFASGQDSESEIDGVRNEGGYYALDAAERSTQPPPPYSQRSLRSPRTPGDPREPALR